MGTTDWKRFLEAGSTYESLVKTLVSMLRDSAVYLAGTALLGLATVVLVPLYTRYLPPEEFGLYALLEMALLIAITVTEMGLGSSYLRWFAETDAHGRGVLLGSCLAAVSCASVVCGVVVAMGVARARILPVFGGAELHCAWTMIPLVWLGALERVLFSDLRALRRSGAFVATATVRLVAVSTASLWFVARLHLRVDGIFYGRLAGDTACVLLAAGFSFRGAMLGLSRGRVVPLLRFGLPLVWSALMGLVLDASGRYFLARFASLGQVGVYAVGLKISNLVSTIYLQPFGFAWASFVFQIAHLPHAQITYRKVLGYALLGAAALASIVTLFSPFLTLAFATPQYLLAQRVIPFLVLPLALRILEYWTSAPIYLSYQTRWMAPIGTFEAGLCLLLNWLLVPRFGMYGAAFAWIAGLSAGIAVTGIVGQRYYHLPVGRKFLGVAAGMWCFALLVRALLPPSVTVAAFLELTLLSGAIAAALAACLYFDFRATKARLAELAYAD